jgi:hypothetical protein
LYCRVVSSSGETMYSAELMEAPGEFLHTGRNSKTKEELREDLADTLNNQNPDEDYSNQSLETVLACLDCVLHEHTERI